VEPSRPRHASPPPDDDSVIALVGAVAKEVARGVGRKVKKLIFG
jgi:hypothetical protein